MKLGLAGLPEDDLSHIVEQVQEDVDLLDGARIVVTGASGFVGTWLTASLVEVLRSNPKLTFEIIVLVRDERTARFRLGAGIWHNVTPVISDVNDQWPAFGPVTHAIHGATPSSARTGGGNVRQVLMTAVTGTHRLIEAIGNDLQPPRVLNLSSGAVYGPQPPDIERMPETWPGGPTPYSPASPYAEGKRAAESLLSQAQRESLLHVVQARLYAFVGPLLPTDEHFAIGNFVGDTAHGRSINVLGDGSAVRSYLDTRDMAVWLLKLLVRGDSHMAYNVGSPDGRSILDWASLCARMGGTPVNVQNGPTGDRHHYVPDIENSRLGGFASMRVPPEEGIESWLHWLNRNQP
jgi:dTDP-glucose 4,6-dehydratase